MGRAAAVDEREQRVEVHRAVVRDGLGERGLEARRAQAPPAPRRDVVVMDLNGAVGHRTRLCVGTPRVLTCESHAPMQPLASTAREARVLAQSQLGIAFFFAIAAALGAGCVRRLAPPPARPPPPLRARGGGGGWWGGPPRACSRWRTSRSC